MDQRVMGGARRDLPQLKRLFGTVAAVAAVVGFVWALRFGISTLVADWATGSATSVSDGMNVPKPMPRTYDLALIVPPSLHALVGGVASETRVRHLEVPLAQARIVAANEARAAGWRALAEALPVPEGVKLGVDYDDYYVTRDGKLVYRTFATEPGGTRREDFELDIRPVREMKEAVDFDKMIARNGRAVWEKLPPVLREILPAEIVATHLIRRAGGSSFVVIAFSAFDEAVAKAQACGTLLKADWKAVEGAACGWARANLFASYSFSARGDGKGTQVFIRISDDERLQTLFDNTQQQQKENT